MRSILKRICALLSFIRSLIIYLLDTGGRSLPQAAFYYVVLPVIIFAFLYMGLGALNFANGKSLPDGFEGLWYCLFFSIGMFTGTGTGNITPHMSFQWLASLEAILALILIALAIGYIVNRLSSR